jgi:hypothetical protein
MSHADATIEMLRATPFQAYTDDDGYWEARVDYEVYARQPVMLPATRG